MNVALSFMAMASSSWCSRRHSVANRKQQLMWKVISAAIIGKSCPICLGDIRDRRAAVIAVCSHAYCVECIRKWSNVKRNCPLCNANFDSCFFNINLSTRRFEKKQLPPPLLNHSIKSLNFEDARRSRRLDERVISGRSSDELNSLTWRTKPLPRRRSFGRPGSVSPDVVAQRVLQWRASIYNRCLQAVPSSSSRNCSQLNMLGNKGVREKTLQKIEPWIRRELQAILGDPDPSVIVHVASSLFITSFEEKHKVSSSYLGAADGHLAPLRPFLHERINMFWHELRCFAESSLNLETYDAVVEYKRLT